MNILLLNLTRFGDLIQSQAAISDLHASGHKLGMVCLENFTEAATFLNHLDYTTSLQGAQLLSLTNPLLGKRDTKKHWVLAIKQLYAWRQEIRKNFPYELVCNLTSSTSARLLAKFLAENKPVTGFGMDSQGYLENSNLWASFLEGTSKARNLSPINIVDIFRGIATAGLSETPQTQQTTRADASPLLKKLPPNPALQQILQGKCPNGCQGFVGLQLGASHEKRRWPVSFFATLGQNLWEQGRFCPILFGSKDEIHLAQEYQAHAKHPYISMCGKTNLVQLAEYLGALQMLITNDTGTMHFAVGFGVPVLGIFLMTAQPFDTGPYQVNSCSLEPDMPCHPCAFGSVCQYEYACGTAIKPELVTELALSFLNHGKWHCTGSHQARIWQAYSERRILFLKALNGKHSDRSAWLNILSSGLCQFLDDDLGNLQSNTPLPTTLTHVTSNTLRAELADILKNIELFLEQGKMLINKPVAVVKNNFMKNWQETHFKLQKSTYLGSLAGVWATTTQRPEQALADIVQAAQKFQTLLRYFQSIIS